MRGSNGLSLSALARRRSQFYLILAAGFSPPTPARVRRLWGAEAARASATLGRALNVPSLEAALRSLGLCLARWRCRGLGRVARELRDDYQRLFVGPYHLEAPPYESCYRGARTVMGAAAAEVRRSYEEAGLALNPDLRELPDHIALELGFLGLLARDEAALRRAGRTAELGACLQRQECFLADHLTRWIAPFSERVTAAARSRFFGALVVVASAYVTADLALVGALQEAVP